MLQTRRLELDGWSQILFGFESADWLPVRWVFKWGRAYLAKLVSGESWPCRCAVSIPHAFDLKPVEALFACFALDNLNIRVGKTKFLFSLSAFILCDRKVKELLKLSYLVVLLFTLSVAGRLRNT